MSNVEHILTWLSGGGLIAIATAIVFVWNQIKKSNDKADAKIIELQTANKELLKANELSNKRHEACESDRKEIRKLMVSMMETKQPLRQEAIHDCYQYKTYDASSMLWRCNKCQKVVHNGDK